MNTHLVARIAYGILVLFTISACQIATPTAAKFSKIGEHLRFEGESAQLNTHSNGRHIFVTGYFGDEGPYNIIVDTGAGPNVIDTELAKKMGLQKTGEREVLSGGVEPVVTDIVIVQNMHVDSLSIENAEFITIGLGEMSLGQFHGVLGMELFREGLLTFDPKNERIEISQAELSADNPNAIPYNASTGGFEIEINAAGQQVAMMFDTGAPSSFTIPFTLSESLPLQDELQKGPDAQLVGGKRSIWFGTLDGDIQLGELVYQNPQVMFMDPSAPHGIIGNAILGDLVLSIDQRSNLLTLLRSDATEITKTVVEETTSEPRRLGIQLRGMGGGALSISWIEPGSLGEQAGFKTGDKLVSLNGRPAEEYDMKDLGKLFKSSTPLRFEVEREGELRIIEIG